LIEKLSNRNRYYRY